MSSGSSGGAADGLLIYYLLSYTHVCYPTCDSKQKAKSLAVQCEMAIWLLLRRRVALPCYGKWLLDTLPGDARPNL